MQLNKLHNAIEAVCPIHGVSIGDATDKNTWTISFKDEATEAEKAAAFTVIDNAALSILDDPRPLSPMDFTDRFTSDEIVAIDTSTSIYAIAVKAALFTAVIIDLDDDKTINGLAKLVELGLLTETRKNEILS